MKLNLSEDALSLALDALEKQHRELVKKADSWSYDLEGDFDNYMKHRQDEINVAAVIHSLKKQRTFRQQNPTAAAEEPLADWEVKLLTGQPVD